MEAIGIALEVYFLGFVIALAMAFIIRLILFIIRRGNKAAEAAEAAKASDKITAESAKTDKPTKEMEGAK